MPIGPSPKRRARSWALTILGVVLGVGVMAYGISLLVFNPDIALRCDRATDRCTYDTRSRVSSSHEQFAAGALVRSSYRAQTKGGSTVDLVVADPMPRSLGLGRFSTDGGRDVDARVTEFIAGATPTLEVVYDGVGPPVIPGVIALAFGFGAVALAIGERRSFVRWRRRTNLAIATGRSTTAQPTVHAPHRPTSPLLAPLVQAVQPLVDEPIEVAGLFTVDRASRRLLGGPKLVALLLTGNRLVAVGVAYVVRWGWPTSGEYRATGVLGDWDLTTVEVDVDETDMSTRALLLRPPGGAVIELGDSDRYGRADYNNPIYQALHPSGDTS